MVPSTKLLSYFAPSAGSRALPLFCLRHQWELLPLHSRHRSETRGRGDHPAPQRQRTGHDALFESRRQRLLQHRQREPY